MERKKNPRARLENYSKLFAQIGLVLTLFIVYQLLEINSTDHTLKNVLGEVNMMDSDKEETPIIKRDELIPPKQVTPAPLPEKIKVIEDDLNIEESIIQNTETDELEAVHGRIIDPNAIVEEIEKEVIIEDVPFISIEEGPVYPGCKGTKEELKACFTKSIQTFFLKRFNTGLANELGLSEGKKRIIVLFKVDVTGEVIQVMAKAPHPRIQKEVEEIIKKLPQMKPGCQTGRPVRVSYTLPITFDIQ